MLRSLTRIRSHTQIRHLRNMAHKATTHGHARLPNTFEWTAHTKRGDYLVQVAWPLTWGEDRVPTEKEVAQTIYVVDGNAYFFSTVDVTRRLEYTNSTRTVVVGIGYPPGKHVYDFRRGPDLTPFASEYEMPLNSKGQPRTDISFGEAGEFLDFIQHDVMPYVHETLFPKASLETGRRALFGHSYGGIFTLNTLLTRPELFNTYIAASPIIWWNKQFLVREQEAAFCKREPPVDPAPSLIVTWGSCHDDLERHPGEPEEAHLKRKGCAEDDQMRDCASAMVARLEKCPSIRSVWHKEFKGEDHGSAAVAGLQQGVMKFVVNRM
ncbi:hypothetical protein FZEAL_6822 [Fusarium zealandicum]|uniref:Ferri-bacillibactin esterase n=1 Tax=Fusarium zealandicum TaxID=1053134 RepID=A0A8H4UHR9_9HYPO|nr:hypothetical protein FZEAL_6822 [Fusarium zealandicum]